MAGPRKRWRTLQLLIFFSLLSLSTELEVKEDPRENLRPDVAALHRLRGASEQTCQSSETSRLDVDQSPMGLLHGFQEWGNFTACAMKKEQDLGALLADIKNQKTNSHNISHNQKLLIMADQQKSMRDRVHQEHIMDPHYSEIVSEEYLYDESCVDPSSRFDQQQIIMLQDDEVVRKAATFLYEKHPAVSSVYVLDNNQKLKLIGGKSTPLSENSRLVLVGHGARDPSGEMRVSGFSYKDVSSIIQSTSRVGDKIRTTRVLACEVGSDQRFTESLLKTLRGAGIETELQLWNAVIQVTRTGHIISQDVSPDGPQWRFKDGSKMVVAALHRNGEMIRRRESGSRGELVFTTETNFLQRKNKKKGPPSGPAKDRSKEYRNHWPDGPKRFIDPDVYIKIDQNHVEQIEKEFEEIESLTWGIFYSEQPAPGKVDTNNQENIKNEYVILVKTGNNIRWLNTKEELQNILKDCYVINSGATTRNIIRHYGKDGEDKSTYLMVNDWIFLVKHQDLYVYPVGKRLDEDQRVKERKTEIMKLIESQNEGGTENYDKIRIGILKGERNSYPYYVLSIFSGQRTDKNFKVELFLTWYFTASVISESARNFRTFPLTLMVLDMAENYVEGAWNMLFDEHPMAQGGSWINENLRGFSGSAAPVIPSSTDSNTELDEKKKQERNEQLDKLKKVLEKELEIFRKWKKSKHMQNLQPVDRMDTLIINYEIFDDGTQFQEDYNNFKNPVTQEENSEACEIGEVASASGPLGGYGDSSVTMKESENSFLQESCLFRKSASFAEEIQAQLKAEHGDDLAGLDLQEGAGNGPFASLLLSDGINTEPNMWKKTVSVSDNVSAGERTETILQSGLITLDSSSEDLNVRIQEMKLSLLSALDGRGPGTLIGGHGADILIGGTGDDTLYGGDGNDTLIGDSGRDVFIPGPGADLVDGGPGRDTVLYRGDHETGEGVYVNLLSGQGRYADAEGDVLKDVETVVGTIYSDILVSGYESALLKGSDGDDILVSTGGDFLVGGEGNDIYVLAFHHGSATVDNCAKDNATDVLYLNSESSEMSDCQLLSDGVLLTFSGPDQTAVNVGLRGWTSDGGECGHLVLVFRDKEVSVDDLLDAGVETCDGFIP